MKSLFLYLGIFLIAVSLALHYVPTQEAFTDASGNSLAQNMANLLNLLAPRIKFNAVDTEPTDITIQRAFSNEDEARLHEMLAIKLKKHSEKKEAFA
jgi:hypothetical protein